MKNRIEYTPESSYCISSQLGKFLYRLDFGMILQDKVVEGISILGKRMYQHGKLIVGVVISKNESKFFPFETKHFPANLLLGQIGLGTFQKELQLGSNGQRIEYQWRGNLFHNMVIPVLTEEFRLTEPVTNAFHIRHGKYFVLGTNSLKDELTCMQHSSRILLTVDKHFSFQQENYNIFLTLSRRQMESSGVGSIYYCIVHSLGTLSALFFTSASRRVGHRQVDLFVAVTKIDK
jgi:hypothetical protein